MLVYTLKQIISIIINIISINKQVNSMYLKYGLTIFPFPNGLLVEHQGWKLVSSKSKCKK